MTNNNLDKQIGDYSEWRSELSETIQSMASFLKSNNVTDLRTHHQFESILGALADDNLSVAFVAEFSRGKSEMINTLFFGHHKQRILPSGAGRTTMCPTELMYDPNRPSCIRLLPIESRNDERPLFELKMEEDLWQEFEFDEDDPESISAALSGMTNNKLVSKNYAAKLNFDLNDSNSASFGLPVNEFDEVEIPCWRHAIINLPHPLLEQGLVVLDTPGLNAIGAEPELTINQLSTAHTVVFILATDTGVTTTDLALWEQHLGGRDNTNSNQRRLVALNKIDSLWDGIRTEEEIHNEIQKQVSDTAQSLNLSADNIYPVSAQQGLVAKVKDDPELLERSRITELERAIADKLIPEKRQIVVGKVSNALSSVIESADIILNNRIKDADEHIAELKQLSTKNTDVISHIMLKVQSEKSALETDMQRYQALRSVYSKETGKLTAILHQDHLEKVIAVTKHNMARCASSITLQKTINKFFQKLNEYLDKASKQANEIAILSEKITRDFETEHGIVNFKVRRLRLERYKQEVARLERKHSSLKDTKTLFFKEQMSITNKFYDSVCISSRKIFKSALQDASNWNKNLMVPMETYVREHHTQLRRRLESVKRIHKASDTVDSRLHELSAMQLLLHEQRAQYNLYTHKLNQLLSLDDNEDDSEDSSEGEQQTAEILTWNHNNNF